MARKYRKLPKVFKKKWIAALRSGEFKQGIGQVYEDMTDRYCCIGVGGIVCGYSKDAIGRTGILPSGLGKVPRAFYESELISQLIDMNDGKGEYKENEQSFAQIADWAELNL